MTNHHKTSESPKETLNTGAHSTKSHLIGDSPDELAAVYLATTSPREAEKAIANHSVAKLLNVPTDPEFNALFPHLEARTERAVKGMVRNSLAVAALVGSTIGGYGVIDIGAAKYAMRGATDSSPNNTPGQIYPNNVLTGSTITIPGTDMRIVDPTSLTYGELVTHRSTDVKHHSTTASTVEEMANNPFGWNLQLQGNEKALDAKALKPVLREIRNNDGTITRVVVHGIVSDDLNNDNLGKTDPQQHALAEARAEAGEAALSSVADQEDVKLPKHITVKASEHVLPKHDLKQIDMLAQQLHLSTNQLIAKYNSNEDLPDDVTEFLAKKLVRGVEYDIDYTTKKTSTSYELVPAGKEADSVKPWHVAALYGGLAAGSAFPISYMVQMLRMPRKRRNQARRDLKKRGYKIK